MKLSAKDLIAIGAVTILSLPVLYLVVLFATGNVHVQFGRKPTEEKRQDDFRVIRLTQRRDSLMAQQSATFRAAEKLDQENKANEKELQEREKRLAMLQQELEQERAALAMERQGLEKAVSESDDASDKKVRQLARVYGAMRPAEAARILETLDDDLVVQILRGIGDDRQKGKIMGAISQGKAQRISRKMGAPVSP